ncbi:MAG: hemolysin family protein, partial [Candidatus Acidiferrales bacterium]
SEHSRYPVHEGSTENVQGLVVVRDLLQQSLEGKEINLPAALRPPLYVPEGTRAVDLVQKFRERRTHIALVVDEHGSVAGVCTLHDILEALVGDLPTGEQTARTASRQRDDGSWLLDGMLPVDELKEMLRLAELPDEEAGDYHTLGGFVMKILRKIPAEGDHFDVAGHTFEVVDMDGRRVDKVLVHGAQPPVK